MHRRSAFLALFFCPFLLAGPATRGDAPKASGPQRSDHGGEPLPSGALVRFGKVRGRHDSRVRLVTSVDLSPDRKLLASGRRDGTIPLREVATGRTVRTLRGHDRSVLSLKFSKDGRKLLSSSMDGTAPVWDVSEILKKAP